MPKGKDSLPGFASKKRPKQIRLSPSTLSQMFTVATLFLLVAAAHGWVCGNDHPHYATEVSTPPVTVPQVYHEDDRRVLAATCTTPGPLCPQTYGAGSPSATTWTPLTTASAAPIRIKVVWDVIATQDTGVCDDGTTGPCTYQCTSSASTGVSVKTADGSTYSTSGFTCSSSDSTGSIIPSTATAAYPITNTNMQIMIARTMEAVAKWSATLSVVPVQDPITILTGTPLGNSAKAITGHLPASALTHSSTDLVVIMTARPSPNSPISGYALCLQQDQWGRCTVGQFNWVPGVLDQAGYRSGSDTSRESELHTALHEFMHIFGGMGPGSYQPTSSFVSNLDGSPLPTAAVMQVLANDPAFPVGSLKPVTYIRTPKVLNLTRTYYDCGTAYGFPLEDVPLGKGAHWEARVAGPELMSYGSNSGQVYISDLTLAYLEDTNHFLANYSNAGWLFPPTYSDAGVAGTSAAFLAPDGTPYIPPPPLTPGIPRWGYKAGCAWLGQAGGNPLLSASILPPYSCSKQGTYQCTSDNRMSAVCSVISTYTTVSDKPTWGQYNQVQKLAAGDTTTYTYGPSALATAGASPGYVNTLPVWARWFSDAGAAAANPTAATTATAANTGGYNDAMDYMPVPVGYWSCAFQVPGSNSTSSGSTPSTTISNIASSFGSSSDMAKFGGQARCPTCRCLTSSLMEMSSLNLNTKFPVYGLCYRTNCASQDYLQIAIKGQLDGNAYWYLCPAEGGKLYIPGFFGALTCPVPATFCALEPITGLRYPEQDIYWEWIFWLVVCGCAFITLVVCGCPCLRNCCIIRCKLVCGARVFDPPGGHHDKNEPLPPIASRALCGVSILTFLAGAGMAGTMAWIIKTTLVFTGTIDVLGIGIMLLVTSIVGYCGSRKHAEYGPSCWAITFFFFDLTLIVLAVFVAVWQFQFSSWNELISVNYYGIVAAGFFSPTNTTLALNQAACVAQVKSNMTALMGLCVAMVLVLTTGLIAAGHLIRLRVLVSIVLSFVNNLLMGFGLLIIAVAIYLFVKNGALLAGMYDVMGYLLGLAILFICVAAAGHCAVRHKSFPLLMVYLFFSLALIGACAGGVWLCFNNVAYIQSWVQGVSDNTLSTVAASLGLSGNKTSFITSLRYNLQKIGLACGVVLILQVLSVVCAAFFGCAAKAWKIQHGLLEGGGAKGGVGGGGVGAGKPAFAAPPSQHHHLGMDKMGNMSPYGPGGGKMGGGMGGPGASGGSPINPYAPNPSYHSPLRGSNIGYP